ncbi:B3/B4 domain-containing protein (DNA/RNA-binding domain of Phe-tRNA-synthetase) [Arthrobacter sp. 9V]|uniref:B3/B4 domain-containing protein n=1 Tax=Arthrobacter sp. 9V TaxID=2653132 RepID=UPI0012F316F9|nr:phenylalanine--tRNA ligase beta subunit-related protein [Arthrobacter sp. 9V]VXB41632.1 B3/B4 domain-containing protein (DNA/RNA-binding domain of Phe-tRNA-synthetase) [Arthrobacter sp. 9V]
MHSSQTHQETLDAAHVEPAVFELRPDYRALLIAVDGLTPGVSDAASNALLEQAEAAARTALSEQKVEQLPHVAAWREAYQGFGAKPNRTRNSLEALIRRADAGLPRVNKLTDLYNAISVLHQIPLGGEDLARYSGAPRLVRATGQEPFDTVANGEPIVEYPDPGEVLWRDDDGVTCRRWNWRQGRRTQLRDETTSALFILDALEPMSTASLFAAGDDLTKHLAGLGSAVTVTQRLLQPGTTYSDR